MRRFAQAACVVALFGASQAWAQSPGALGYQGRLFRADGQPESGMVTITFALFASPTGGTPLWTETQVLSLDQGFYSTFLGDTVPIPESVFDGSERYLEPTVNAQPLLPRQRVAAVAYARRASTAKNVQGGAADVTSLAIGGTTVIDSTGKLVGPAAVAGVPSGLIGFFAGACPTGWTEYAPLQGRLVLGLPAGGTVGGTKGTSLGNLAALPVTSHSHTASQPAHNHGMNSAGGGGTTNEVSFISNGDGCCGDLLTTSTTPAITVNSAGDTNGPPYIQLRACQKN